MTDATTVPENTKLLRLSCDLVVDRSGSRANGPALIVNAGKVVEHMEREEIIRNDIQGGKCE